MRRVAKRQVNIQKYNPTTLYVINIEDDNVDFIVLFRTFSQIDKNVCLKYTDFHNIQNGKSKSANRKLQITELG